MKLITFLAALYLIVWLHDEMGPWFWGFAIVVTAAFLIAALASNQSVKVAPSRQTNRRKPVDRVRRKTGGAGCKQPAGGGQFSAANSLSISDALAHLPAHLLDRSGSLFYSAPSAFSGPRRVYVLGLNPGGSPQGQAAQTVRRSLESWRLMDGSWSAYLDESWEGKAPGQHGLQPRMAHLFREIGLDLRDTPSSNVVFVRSATEAALAREMDKLLRECWPVHAAVLRDLQIDTILCLGGTAGRWVRTALSAQKPFDQWRENNARGWTSEAHVSADGRAVITLTHPGRANWCNLDSDPSPLVKSVLNR